MPTTLEEETTNKIIGDNKEYFFPVLEFLKGIPKEITEEEIKLCSSLINLVKGFEAKRYDIVRKYYKQD